MKITIDLEEVRKHGLNISQYIWMYLQYEEKFIDCASLTSLTEDDFNLLQMNSWLDDNNLLTEKAKKLFKNDVDTLWKEFKTLYPKKSGERRLIDKEDKCKQKFETLIKEKGVKEEIIQGLKNEIQAREAAKQKRQFFPEPKMLATWLNNKCWKTYLDYTKEEVIQKEKFKTI